MRLLKPFLLFLCIFLSTFLHHSAKDISSAGVRYSRLKGKRISYQNCLAKLQVHRRCCTISCSWSHRTQTTAYCSPLLVNLSAVQHLFFIANQRKDLHFGGAQDFHKRFHGSNKIEPMKKPYSKTLRRTAQKKNASIHVCKHIEKA
jgi:ribosomal protein L31